MNARIEAPTSASVAEAASLLRQDELVGMPTETVYGLAGNAFSATALAKIFATKERPTFDPLIVHVAPEMSSLESLRELVDLTQLTSVAQKLVSRLIAKFWPGPLTLVLPKTLRIPDLATSGLGTVAIRMPAHPIAQKLLRETGFPLAAPSANRFGRISPTTAEAVQAELGDRIHLILDGGPCAIGVESTVVAVTPDAKLQCLRPGGVPAESLEEIAGSVVLTGVSSEGPTRAQIAPGMLASHYAPMTPLAILPAPVSALAERPIRPAPPAAPAALGLLVFSGDAATVSRDFARALGEAVGARTIVARSLSRGGELSEAARNLFAALRELDAEQVAQIYAEPCPSDEGLGYAIRDRLTRAAVKLPS